jgi:hypothetical protein
MKCECATKKLELQLPDVSIYENTERQARTKPIALGIGSREVAIVVV